MKACVAVFWSKSHRTPNYVNRIRNCKSLSISTCLMTSMCLCSCAPRQGFESTGHCDSTQYTFLGTISFFNNPKICNINFAAVITSEVIASLIYLRLQCYMVQDIPDTKTVNLLMLETWYFFHKPWAYLRISRKKISTSFTLKRHKVQNPEVTKITLFTRKLHESLQCTIIGTEFLITQMETAKLIKMLQVISVSKLYIQNLCF